MKEIKTISSLLHLLGALPVGGTIATALIWFTKKNESHEINQEGIKALNFQLTFIILTMIAGWFSNNVAYGVHIFVIVYAVLIAYKTFTGKTEEYPYSFKFIS